MDNQEQPQPVQKAISRKKLEEMLPNMRFAPSVYKNETLNRHEESSIGGIYLITGQREGFPNPELRNEVETYSTDGVEKIVELLDKSGKTMLTIDSSWNVTYPCSTGLPPIRNSGKSTDDCLRLKHLKGKVHYVAVTQTKWSESFGSTHSSKYKTHSLYVYELEPSAIVDAELSPKQLQKLLTVAELKKTRKRIC